MNQGFHSSRLNPCTMHAKSRQSGAIHPLCAG
jgi:hypothetical protein